MADDPLLRAMFDVLNKNITADEMTAAKAAMIAENGRWLGSSVNDWAKPIAAVIGAGLKAIADARSSILEAE
jgi:hypothetical protein